MPTHKKHSRSVSPMKHHHKRQPTARNKAIGKLLHKGYTMAQANHKLGSTGHKKTKKS